MLEVKKVGPDSARTDIILSSGEVIKIDKTRIMENGICIEDAASDSDSFCVGFTSCKMLTLTALNIDDKYSLKNFEDAQVIPYIINNGEEYKRGVFNVQTASLSAGKLKLECYDDVYKFEKDIDKSLFSLPCTFKEALKIAVLACSVTLSTSDFDNDDVVINDLGDITTYRQLIGYIMQAAGSVLKSNESGALIICNYNRKFEKDDNTDGGLLNNYETGDMADGGNFTNYNTENIVDGGRFGDRKDIQYKYDISDITVAAQDTIITGICVKIDDSKYEIGTEEYMLDISGNPLITEDNVQEILSVIANKYVGMRFRKLSGKISSDFRLESMDPLCVMDYKGNAYDCYITRIAYTIGSKTSLSCDAKEKQANKTSENSVITKLLQMADNNSKKRVDAESILRQQAVKELSKKLANSNGMYYTAEESQTGGTIYYTHDRPALKDSTFIMKFTSQAIGLSTDGGKSYPFGFTITAKMVMDIIIANKISADYIEGGTLVLGGNSNTNGTIAVYDAKGNLVATLDKDGLVTKNGSFEGTIKSANAIITGGKIDISTTDDSAVIRFTYTTESGSKVTNEFRAGSMRITNEDGSYVDIEGHIINIVDAQGNTSVVLGRGGVSEFNKGVIVKNDMQIGEKGKTARVENWCDTTRNAFYIFNDEGTHLAPINYEFNLFGAAWIKYSLHVGNGIYGSVASTTDSDANVKKDIESLSLKESATFIYNLKPAKYRLINGTSNRYHHGFIAQETREAMQEDWGLYIDNAINNPNYNMIVDAHDLSQKTKDESIARYGLRYEELIADIVATLQSQNERIKELENKIGKGD